MPLTIAMIHPRVSLSSPARCILAGSIMASDTPVQGPGDGVSAKTRTAGVQRMTLKEGSARSAGLLGDSDEHLFGQLHTRKGGHTLSQQIRDSVLLSFFPKCLGSLTLSDNGPVGKP
ncbi:hypothetical protein VTK73DRAFT_5669 [Phialemonium thermophilum]|uniref:Uncharacterized protein n=1 Tax=Phialemonium thermophilum TaxID=223376 RepID=A0ABR3V0U3_9PEZI